MKRIETQTLYEILEVPRDASPAAIRAAVERARELYGPGSLATYSLISPEETAALTRRIDEAEQTLLDPDLRGLYDEEIARPEPRQATGGAPTPPPGAPRPPAVLPPVIPARHAPLRDAGDEDEEGDLDREDRGLAEAPPAPAVLPAADAPSAEAPRPVAGPEAEASPAGPPAAEPPAAPAPAAAPPAPAAAPRAPILLSKEFRPPAPAPLPPLADAPAPPAPPPAAAGPIATPVPMNPVPPQPPAVDATLWTGEVLRQLREARGISLPQLAERTKVTRHHIENIEADRFGLLPAPVYLRGILLSIARELRLDGQKVARSYLERFTTGGAPPAGGGSGRSR